MNLGYSSPARLQSWKKMLTHFVSGKEAPLPQHNVDLSHLALLDPPTLIDGGKEGLL